MMRGKVVMLSDYRDAAAGGLDKKEPVDKPLPDVDHPWQLLDRNIDVEIWKKRI